MRPFFLALTAIAFLSRPLLAAEPEPALYPTCERPPTAAEVSGAKGAYEAGQASFNEADYQRAILYWEDALRRDCTADKLLLNLARAYELAGQRQHAMLALETYLERRPATNDRPAIEKRIANLRQQATAEENALPPSVPVATQPPAAGAATSTSEKTGVASPTAPTQAPAARPRPIWPVLVTGAGVVLAGVGLSFFIPASITLGDVNCTVINTTPTCYAHPPTTTTAADETERKNSALLLRNVSGVGALVGAGAIAGGAVAWYFAWRRPAGTETAHFSPQLGPSFAGLSYQGTF